MKHITDAVGWLGCCFCGFAIFLVVLKLWKKHIKKINGMALYSYVWFVAFWCVAMAYGISRLPKETTVTEHNVAILTRLDNGDFAYRSDEKPQGDTFRPCKQDAESGLDVDGMLMRGVGYVAEHAVWQERGTCRSILRADLGFWFKDQANNFTYRRLTDVRPTQ